MRRVLVIAMVVVGAMLVVSLGLLYSLSRERGAAPPPSDQGFVTNAGPSADPLKPDHLVEGLTIPAFTMRNQDGAEVSEAVFDGRVTIVDFIFTDCPSICPMMNGVMSELAGTLVDTPVQFVSISVNPERDTPQRLKEYGGRYGADFSRWTFLTGDWETAKRIVHDALMFALSRNPDVTTPTADGSSTYNVVHPGKLVLIGPERQVLAMYDYAFENEVNMLAKRARAAAGRLGPLGK